MTDPVPTGPEPRSRPANLATRWARLHYVVMIVLTIAVPFELRGQGFPLWVCIVCWAFAPLALCGFVADLLGCDFAVEFKWFDLWIGAFIDRPRHRLYVCPLPCLVLVWEKRR